MRRKYHNLKILPKYFRDIESGVKSFEIRFNDRNFAVGDILILEEYSDGNYTGRTLWREVCYVIGDPEYCKEGFVVLGLKERGIVNGIHRLRQVLPRMRVRI